MNFRRILPRQTLCACVCVCEEGQCTLNGVIDNTIFPYISSIQLKCLRYFVDETM